MDEETLRELNYSVYGHWISTGHHVRSIKEPAAGWVCPKCGESFTITEAGREPSTTS